MPDAQVMVRDSPHYRRESFVSGLAANGFSVTFSPIQNPTVDDLLLVWCRYGETHAEACRFERAGARVIVAENGYLGRDWRGDLWYALAHNWHAGHGRINVGGPERARAMFDEPEAWAPGKGPAVILGQRGIGSPPVAAPHGWAQRVMRELYSARIDHVYREHPGAKHDTVGLLAQLHGSRFAVAWSSGALLKSILHGTPVYHGLPNWIGADAAAPYSLPLPAPFLGDRWAMLQRLSWAQWRLSEIASGDAFNHLLR